MATRGDARGAGRERAWCAPLPAEGVVRLSPEESAHLVRVRRVGVGEEVVLFDGAGRTRGGVLEQADPRAAAVRLTGPAPDREPRRPLVVAASPPEPGRADDLVEGLAWLGVSRWVPLRCARTPAGRLEALARRAERFERIARESAKGNGRSRLLAVSPGLPWAALLAQPPPEGLVLLDPDPSAPTLLALLAARGPSAPLPWLLVGPEGGFTPEEREAASARGAAVAQLCATALRVEQAALAAAAQALGQP